MDLESTIAERELTDVESGKPVRIRVERPQQVADDEWCCRFSVEGAEHGSLDRAYGIDSLQAFVLALEGIRLAVEGRRDQLSWLGGPSGELGLSRRVPDFLGLKFERGLNELIDCEMAALTRELKEKTDSA
ncbi:MAG: DUF6968 family protein [Gemmatimonadota bacterium]